MITFGWDERKSRANRKKHGVSFEEAQSAFFDENPVEFADPDPSDDEDRFLSARKATKTERGYYAQRGRK